MKSLLEQFTFLLPRNYLKWITVSDGRCLNNSTYSRVDTGVITTFVQYTLYGLKSIVVKMALFRLLCFT